MTSIPNENGFLIEKKFLFAGTEPDTAYINLATHTGEDMRYKKLDYMLVDYPGEYDIDTVTIQCFAGNEEKLNYLLSFNGKKIAIIQSPEVLENNTELCSAQEWFYTEDTILNKLEQLELEGEKTKVEKIGNATL